MIAVPREAATLVLMRDRPGDAPEVLMVQRHGQDAFAAGAYVFPGGVLESEDWSPQALSLCEGLSPESAAARLSLVEKPERALGYYLAAIRETFEEIGILLVKPRPGAAAPEPGEGALRVGREAVRGGKGAFWGWLRECGLRPAVENLAYFAHWITPAGRPKRFDTRFFLAPVPSDARPEPDLEEIVDCLWITPAEAIAAERGKRMRMLNATVKNLEVLAEFASTAEALESLGRCEVPAILPKLVPQGDGYRVVLPWEPGYDLV